MDEQRILDLDPGFQAWLDEMDRQSREEILLQQQAQQQAHDDEQR